MVKRLSYNSLLLGALAVLSACSGSDGVTTEKSPPEDSQQWTVSVVAGNSDVDAEDDGRDNQDDGTRAMFFGGNDGNRYSKGWDSGDVVYTYKSGTLVGTLSPSSSDYGYASATLQGTLTGSFSVGDALDLYMPSRAMNFTGQTGTMQSVSVKAYRQTTTNVSQISGNSLTLTGVIMDSRTTFGRFFLTDETTGARLHPSRLVIHAVEGPSPVLRVDETGAPIERGDIVINGALSDGEYPGEIYVSMYKETETFRYILTATVGEDTYVGPIVGQNPIKSQSSIGGLMNYRRKMRKTTPVSSLSVSSVASRTFTGYAQEPTGMTVRDGATTLTAGTDYAFEYSSNVNVGEATVVVRGLADAGATCATKYLGTQDVHFNITKATPKIQINTSTLELGYGSTPETRTVSRVYIDNNANNTYEAAIDYDITSQCTVIYVSNNTGICSVDGSGVVTPVGTGSTTITVQVYAAANWNSASAYYPVSVSAGVRNGNAVSNWSDGGSTPGKVYVE